jgi:serine phosphatase RsbU (regulator of sigma subunit)
MRAIFLILSFALGVNSFSQIISHLYNVSDGLPENSIDIAYVSDDGTLYLTTSSYFFTLNGHGLQRVRPLESTNILNFNLSKIVETKDDIWTLTPSGLSVFHKRSSKLELIEAKFDHLIDHPNEPSINMFLDILSYQGKLYILAEHVSISTSGYGNSERNFKYLLNFHEGKLHFVQDFELADVNYLVAIDSNLLIYGTKGAYKVVSNKHELLYEGQIHTSNKGNYHLNSIYFMHQGKISFTDYDGYLYHMQGDSLFKNGDKYPSKVHFSRKFQEKELIITNLGVHLFEEGDIKRYQRSDTTRLIDFEPGIFTVGVLVDENLTWITTKKNVYLFEGLNLIDNIKVDLLRAKNPVKLDDGTVLIATANGLLALQYVGGKVNAFNNSKKFAQNQSFSTMIGDKLYTTDRMGSISMLTREGSAIKFRTENREFSNMQDNGHTWLLYNKTQLFIGDETFQPILIPTEENKLHSGVYWPTKVGTRFWRAMGDSSWVRIKLNPTAENWWDLRIQPDYDPWKINLIQSGSDYPAVVIYHEDIEESWFYAIDKNSGQLSQLNCEAPGQYRISTMFNDSLRIKLDRRWFTFYEDKIVEWEVGNNNIGNYSNHFRAGDEIWDFRNEELIICKGSQRHVLSVKNPFLQAKVYSEDSSKIYMLSKTTLEIVDISSDNIADYSILKSIDLSANYGIELASELYLVNGTIVVLEKGDGLTDLNYSQVLFLDSTDLNWKRKPPAFSIEKAYTTDDSISWRFWGKPLDYDQNNLIFEFYATALEAPSTIEYRYRLRGLSEEWSIQKSNKVEFIGLQPGSYDFQIQARALNGEWSYPWNVPFTINPPYWETTWFRSSIVGFVLITIFLIFRIRTRALRARQKTLENTVEVRTKELAVKHEQLEETHKEITDSIAYAKRIQSAILPPIKLVKEYLKDSFILYKPKDVVAGDFYWMENISDKILFAAADCTGHGVPGAMVSVLCNGALNRAVREFNLEIPGEILDKAREIVIEEFEKSEEEVKDGMDIALCSLEKNVLQYAGAHNPLWLIRNGEIVETKADKQPIGKFDKTIPYTTHNFNLEKGDSIYIFSDGFVDQFGGEKGKKFKAKAFRELLLSIQSENMDQQKRLIDNAFEKWRGKIEQIDDVCVIGVRV